MVNPTSEFPKQLFWPDYKIQLQDWEMFPSSYHYYDFSTSPIWSLFTINSRPNHRSCPLQRLFENCLLFTTGGPCFTHFHFMSFKLYLAFRKVLSNTISPYIYSFLDRHLGWRSQDPTLDLSPNFVKKRKAFSLLF